MKKLLIILILSLLAIPAGAQVYKGDGGGYLGPPPSPVGVGSRYRLRDTYPAYPGPSTQSGPDTAVVGQPTYYPYGYGYPGYGYPGPGGIVQDGDSVYVPGP